MDQNLLALGCRQLVKEFCRSVDQPLLTAPTGGIHLLRSCSVSEIIPVDRRTVERWRTWWRDAKGQLKAEIEALAARTWQHPITGQPVRFGFSSIERWLYIALAERIDRHDGWDRLGMVYEARGNSREAADCYRRVLDFLRDNPDYTDDDGLERQFTRLVAKLDPPAATD